MHLLSILVLWIKSIYFYIIILKSKQKKIIYWEKMVTHDSLVVLILLTVFSDNKKKISNENFDNIKTYQENQNTPYLQHSWRSLLHSSGQFFLTIGRSPPFHTFTQMAQKSMPWNGLSCDDRAQSVNHSIMVLRFQRNNERENDERS